jgi:sugar lactone lactonase YvrE
MRAFLLTILGLNLFLLSHGQTNVSGNRDSKSANSFHLLTIVLDIQESISSITTDDYESDLKDIKLTEGEVQPKNEHKPVLESIELIDNISEDSPFTFYQNNFWSKIHAHDDDGDRITYVVTKILAGNLYHGFGNNTTAVIVGDILDSEKIHGWQGPSNENGEIKAFKIRATDGQFVSENELTVIFNVSPSNDLITITTEPKFTFEQRANGNYRMKIGKLSPGENEEEQNIEVTNVSADNDLVDQESINFQLNDARDSLCIDFHVEENFEGIIEFRVFWNDGLYNTQFSFPVGIYKKNEAPIFTSEPIMTAYVEMEYEYNPMVTDESPVQIIPQSIPSFLIADSTWVVANLIGLGKLGDLAGGAKTAMFKEIIGMDFDSKGNLFVIDRKTYKISKITQEGEVIYFAGGSDGLDDGQGGAILLSYPTSLKIDRIDNIWITDNDRLIKVTADGIATIVIGAHGKDGHVDGSVEIARLEGPNDIAFDSKGNIFIMDSENYAVRKFNLNSNKVSTYIDNNTQNVKFAIPFKFAINSRDEMVIADSYTNKLLKVIEGVVEVIELPKGFISSFIEFYTDDIVLFSHSDGGDLFLFNLVTKELNQIGGEGVSPFENGMPARNFSPKYGFEMTVKNGRIYLAEMSTGSIRIYYPTFKNISGIPTDGFIGEQEISLIARDVFGEEVEQTFKLTVNPSDKVSASNLNQNITYNEDELVDFENIRVSSSESEELFDVTLRLVKPSDGILTAESGNGEVYSPNIGEWFITGTKQQVNAALESVVFNPQPNLDTNSIIKVSIIRSEGHVPNEGLINLIVVPENDDLVIDPLPTDIGYSEFPYNSNFSLIDPDDYYFDFNVIAKPDWLTITSDSEVIGYAGNKDEKIIVDGSLTDARFVSPSDMVMLDDGSVLFLDQYRIRKLTSDGQVVTIAGSEIGSEDGLALEAKLGVLSGLAVDQFGNIFFGDNYNKKLKMLDRNGIVKTIAGQNRPWLENGWQPSFYINRIRDITISPQGEIFILEGYDSDPWRILKINSDAEVETVLKRNSTSNNEGAFDRFGGYVYSIKFSKIGSLILGGEGYIWEAKLAQKRVKILAGNGYRPLNDGEGQDVGISNVSKMESDQYGNIWFLEGNIIRVLLKSTEVKTLAGQATFGYKNGKGSDSQFGNPKSILDLEDGFLLVADTDQGNFRKIKIQNLLAQGTPLSKDIGENNLKIQFMEGYLNSYLLDMQIDVQSNGMPLIAGLDQEYTGEEDDEKLAIHDIAISEVEDANVELSFFLANSEAGIFKMSESLENEFSSETGEWKVKGSQDQLNSFLSSFEFYPAADFYGLISVKVKAKRENGLFTREGEFQIVLNPVNDDPILESPLKIEAMEELPLDVKINVNDIDNGSYNLDIENMPSWMVLNVDLETYTSTFGDFTKTYNESNILDGNGTEANFYNPKGLAFRKKTGDFYTTDATSIRKISASGEVSTVYTAPTYFNGSRAFNGIDIINDEIFVYENARIYKLTDNMLELVGGDKSGYTGDMDGQGTNARFNIVRDIISDGLGGFYVATRQTIRHMTSDFDVTTIAGNGVANDEAGFPFYFNDIVDIKLVEDGSILISNNNYNKGYYRYNNRIVEEAFPETNNQIATPTKFFALGTSKVLVFYFGAILLYDTSSDRLDFISGKNTYPIVDGLNGEASWGRYNDVVQIDKNKYAFFDSDYADIRVVTINSQYELRGTPTSGNYGTSSLKFNITDIPSNTITIDVPLEILPSDRPELSGLPQSYSFVEDDLIFTLDPVEIITDDELQIFNVSFKLYNTFGSVISTQSNLKSHLSNQSYVLKGTKSELNSIISTLSYEPGLNASTNGFLQFEVIRENGSLAYTNQISFDVTSVNDLPTVECISDTIAYVGDSLSIEFDFFDIEDGKNLNVQFQEKPSWLKYKLLKSKSELIAGDPDGKGFYYNKKTFVGPYDWENISFDADYNILLSDAATSSIVKIEPSGEISLVAGSGKMGYEDGEASNARFLNPTGVVFSPNGVIYVSDAGNNRIRAIDSNGMVTTLAGTGEEGSTDGAFEQATFRNLKTLIASDDGSKLYVQQRYEIRMIDLVNRQVSTILNVTNKLSNGIYSFDIASNEDILVGAASEIYRFSDSGQQLFKFGIGYGLSDGPFYSARISDVTGIKEGKDGNIYFTDAGGTVLRRITPDLYIHTIAGRAYQREFKDGIEDKMQFYSFGNILWKDDAIYLAERKTVRKISVDQPLFFGRPTQEDIGQNQVSLTIEDSENGVASADFLIQVVPNDRLEVVGLDTAIFVQESVVEVKFPKIKIESEIEDQIQVEIQIAGELSASLGYSENDLIDSDEADGRWLLLGSVDELNAKLPKLRFYSNSWQTEKIEVEIKKIGGKLSRIGEFPIFVKPENERPKLLNNTSFEISVAELFELDFSALDPDGDILSFSSNNIPAWLTADSSRIIQPFVKTVYSENLPDSIKQKLAVDIRDIAITSKGDTLIADALSNRILMLVNGAFEPYAGTGITGFQDGPISEAMFNVPNSLLVRSNGDILVGDEKNSAVRVISESGQVSTLIGNGPIQYFTEYIGYNDQGNAIPLWISDLAEDEVGNLYTSEAFSIGKVEGQGGYSHFAGDPAFSFTPKDIDGTQLESRFYNIRSLIALGEDSLLIWDSQNYKLKVLANGEVNTIAGFNGFGLRDGNLGDAQFSFVRSSELLRNKEVLFFDIFNLMLRSLDLKDKTITTLAGTGYQGEKYGALEEVVLTTINAIKELSNGDVLLGGINKIDRMSYTVPKISGTPQLADIGEHKFTLRISDGKDGIIEEEITINVIAPNTQPEVLEISDIEETYSEEGSIEISLFDYFSDFENTDSELTYELISNTDNSVVTSSSISSVDGLLKLVVVNAGTTTLTVEATDLKGASVSTSFEVVIAKAEAAIEFGALSFINSGEAKEITVTTVPSELNYTITYAGETTAPSLVGKYAIVVTIDERNYAKEVTAELEIVNVAPEGMALSNDQIIENSGSAVIGNLSVTDQNPTDEHTFSLVEGEKDNALFSISENVLSSNSDFNYEEASSYTVSVKVEDNYGGSLVKELTISVVDINESPTIDAYDEIQIVKNLGSLSINLTGLSAGEEANQTISLSTTNSAFIKSSTVTLNADGASATLVFETSADQEGEASIQVTVKDNGGTSNGGVDAKTIEIPIEIIAPNISVIDGSNCGSGEVTMTASGANEYKWYSAPLDGSLLFEGSDFIKDVESTTEFFVAGVFNGVESKLRVPVKAVIFDELQAPQVTNNNNVLSVTSVSGISYQWFNNEESIDGATSNSFTPTETGNYSVRISNENGCFATSAVVEVVIAGIEDEYFELGVNIYPVPTSDYVYLEFSETLKKGAVLRLIDVSGKELVIYTSQAPTNKLTLDVSKVVMGMHTLIIVDGNRVARKKILIQR